MPSDQSTWLVAVPNDGEAEGVLQELQVKLDSKSLVSQFRLPSFKTGTLDILIYLSEDLPKQDTFFTNTVAKIVDTLRNLLNNDASKLTQHTLVNEQTVDNYILHGWRWNEGRYTINKGLPDIVGTLAKEMSSIDNVTKTKLANYTQAKGSLTQMQRKKQGNLSVRSLADIVTQEYVIPDSEYLETVFVAVPKNLVKEWNARYERLTSMVVPRSGKSITSDEEFTLYSVVIFKRVKDEFAQKCRENKYILRDFAFSEEQQEKQKEELSIADTTEKELWNELLRLSRTNFSEAFQLLVHLKVVRCFVESVLRYGLPAEYTCLAVKPEAKSQKRTLQTLTNHFAYLAPQSNATKSSGKSKQQAGNVDLAGEYQTLMEQEFLDFVLFEIPWITD